jgi:hypothetical protein
MKKFKKFKHKSMNIDLTLTNNVMPEGQGKRDTKRPRHDLIPIEFLDELASIFEEGLTKYGDSWKKGGDDFLIDCLNHASNHLHLYMSGDRTENHLAKVAWNTLVIKYFQK